MEAAALREDGRTSEEAAGEGTEALSLGLISYASPHLHDDQHHHRLLRSDGFPFRVASSCHGAAAGASTAPSDGRAAGPPRPSRRRTLASSPPNSGVGGGGGGTAAFGHGAIADSADSYGAPRALRPVNSAGMDGDATFQLCSPFTTAQWQELHRQALIFKCIVTSAPVPPDLLLTHGPFPGAGHPFFSNLSRGGDYLNLRFTGANGDLEPGRCRRTDGKKWRCSKDVSPGQKYCERHVHRARPRSRKPVELDGKADPATAAANIAAETVSTSSGAISHHRAPSTTAKPAAAARPSAQPPGLPATGGDLKFPFQFMVVPEGKKLRDLGSSGGVHDAEALPATQQWQLPHSKRGFDQQQQQHSGDNRLNLRCSSLNDHHGCPFPGTDVSALDVTDPHDRSDTQRRFIDAWSRSENPFDGVTIGDGYKTNCGADGRNCVRSLENLSPSTLTLSMSGAGDGGGELHHDHFQMGMRATDSGKMLGPSWMSSVSPIGGPLAEVLQTSSAVSFRNERPPGHENDAAGRGSGGLIDLMCKRSCDSEGTSPRSPTRVLQKALVSLSDSSSHTSSNTTFGPRRRPELGLQWASPFD